MKRVILIIFCLALIAFALLFKVPEKESDILSSDDPLEQYCLSQGGVIDEDFCLLNGERELLNTFFINRVTDNVESTSIDLPEVSQQKPTASLVDTLLPNRAIPESCVSWYDGCNTCKVNNGKIVGCTKVYCIHQDTPKCLAYK